MIRFESDYTEGAIPEILRALEEHNFVQTGGYGVEAVSDAARARVRELCAAPDAQVHFLVGGTQTNLTVLACALPAASVRSSCMSRCSPPQAIVSVN